MTRQKFLQLSAINSGLKLIKDPTRLDHVLNISDKFNDLATTEDLQPFAERLFEIPGALETIESRYRVWPIDLENLRTFKEGTLGRAFAHHIDDNQITIESLAPPEVTDDLSYLTAHFYETHDIWHTVTGYRTDIPGELALAAFGAAQFPSQFELLLLAGGLLNTSFYNIRDCRKRMDSIVKGWELGKKAKPLFGVRWSELWDRDLEAIRRELRILPHLNV